MSQGRRSPLLPTLLFALVCSGLLYGTLHLIGQPFHWAFAAILAYLTLTTLALHLWQEGGPGTDPKVLMRRFMTGLVLKMLISLFLLLAIVVLSPRPLVVPLALSFALLYLAFLGYSTARLSGLSKNPAA
jgi:predicted small integral membrane protein